MFGGIELNKDNAINKYNELKKYNKLVRKLT